MADRWVIYSAFDPEGRLLQHAIEQVAAYRAAGSAVLVVDTSPTLSPERSNAWDTHATAWFQRENRGFDFGSYVAGLTWIRTHALDGSYSLLLTNDSCYGPFLPLESILQRFDQSEETPAVFGITDSHEIGYHLQSYFLYFQPQALRCLADFFMNMKEIHSRSDATYNGEIALSRYLLEHGVKLKALSPVCELVAHLSFHRWLRVAELVIRKLLKTYRYDSDRDLKYMKYLLRPSLEPGRFDQTLLAGVELFRLGLSPFVKRRFFREGSYYRYGFAGRYATPAVLTNHQVYSLLTKNIWF